MEKDGNDSNPGIHEKGRKKRADGRGGTQDLKEREGEVRRE